MAEPTTFTGERRVFTVVARLGTGSTAVVYRVRDAEGADYALKQTLSASGDGTEARAEADLLEALAAVEARRFPDSPSRFPAVVDRDPAGRWFAMEIAAGQSVADLLSEGRTLRPEQNVAIALRVAEALQLVEAEGKAATDLKPDAIFWSARSGRVIIIDWNVLADGGADPAEPLSHHARLVAGLLDALFRHDHVPAWNPPFATPPGRWETYPRLVADRLGHWSAADAEGVDLDRVVSGLHDLDAVFGRAAPELLADARACLATVRARRVVAPARRAAGLAQRAERVDSGGAVRFACRELMKRADDYLGPDGPKLLALWAVIDGEDASPPPGDALELIRLRALAGVVRRAPGYAEEVGALADAFLHQRWAEIPKAARRLAERIDDPAVTRLLDDVGREAAAFTALARALDLSTEDRDAVERARLKARIALARVEYAEQLLMQFEDFAELFDGASGSIDEAGPLALAPPPLQRPRRFAEPRPDPLAGVRQRFAERSITRLDDLGPLAESVEGRDFARLVSTWQAVYDASPDELLDFVTRLEQAIEVSRARDGCLPLDDFGVHLDGLRRRLDDALVDAKTPDDPARLADMAERMSGALEALRGAVGRSALPDGWRQASLERLDGAVGALDRFAERAREVGAALRDWRAEEVAWSLPRRLEHLDRLGRRFGELAFVRHAQSALVDEVDRLSIERPADRERLRELDEARRHLGLGPLRTGRPSMRWALALLVLGAAVGGGWWMKGRDPGRPDAGTPPADAGLPAADVALAGPLDAAPDAAAPAPPAERDAAPPPVDAAAADTTPRRRRVRRPPPRAEAPPPPPAAPDAAPDAAPPDVIRGPPDKGSPQRPWQPDPSCPQGYECF